MSKTVKRFPPSDFSGSDTSVSSARLPRLLKSFLLHGDITGHSQRTIDNRNLRINGLIWYVQREEFEAVGLDELRAFFHYMRHGHKEPGGLWGAAGLQGRGRSRRPEKQLSNGTIKSYYSSIRTFFNWLVSEGEILASPVERIDPPVDRPDQVQPFTEAQLRALQEAARKSKREAAIFAVLIDTGIRVTELCQLAITDANLADSQVLIRQGKGGKSRSVPLSTGSRRAIYDWLRERGEAAPDSPLFISQRGRTAGEAMTREGIQHMVARWGTVAKITQARCSPHTFRHSFAVMFLRAGGDVFTLRMILGHESLTMVNRYVALAEADVVRKHAQFSPLGQLKGKPPR